MLIEVADASAVGEVRRVSARAGEQLAFDEVTIGRISVVVSELATNLVKHATRGLVIITPNVERGELEIVALDHGSGIADISQALHDGHSTAGTSGTGLGAISRQADFFNVYSRPKAGTVVLARFGNSDNAELGAMSIPILGEWKNGDSWAASSQNGTRTVMVVDGLGHGDPAHEAAVAACEAFAESKGSASMRLQTVHNGLRHTRGAAVAIAELDPNAGVMRFAGVGNISAITVDRAARRATVSIHGIAGHDMRALREFAYPWTRESTLIMHSDGVSTRWNLDDYPGLIGRDPALIAAVLWNDHRRHNDDSTIVVVRTP
jgi:anti-sigma regulatory factor (Ser/Thr protein kinase)